ncbi:tyrosine-type recombinase/integrase [Vibrio cholerae]|uniref:tyrosine-type recombinase/integrase n=1 Tax=Vibrio cholerae TaxID=666 RepID=UPI001C92D397|nr:tyrosine-type recombinase/integrase [Vibrio cholerae]MBY4642219.1 tyrosine-type recombinase/integrase [Vibrio cholerae]MCR9658491.1 tyrosine-type recombinase/integrase [Vibrio cholerae]MCR9689173.1 tyrosine-type recombinase/integrase [Vibrio cholerae]MCR9746504.1 tyrosine-type recombinase/integrase [Vibrio cholerae]
MKTKVVTFSERTIKAEQAGSARTLRDPAFPLRFRFHQSRETGSWYVVRRDEWHLLGYWPVLTVQAVKTVLPEKLALLAVNPKSNLLQADFESVNDVLTWYQGRIEKDAHRSKNRKATIRSAIKCHLMPRIGELAIDALNRQVIDDALIWPLQEHHSLASVKSVLAVLKQAFKQAEKLGRVDRNPLASIVFTDFISVPIKEKDGRLFASSMESLFECLTSSDRVTQCLVIMLIGHATRITETLCAKWSHIDLVDRYWRIPMGDTKTHDWHKLPLTDQMVAFLSDYRDWQRTQGYRGVFVFPGHGHAKPLSYSASRTLLKKVSQGEWSAHDCRKATKTIMTSVLSINDAVSERILNHAMSSLRKAYDQGLYDVPMLEALTKYHDWLDTRGFKSLRGETETRSTRSINHHELNAHAA